MTPNQADVVVIGSGMGGSTFAAGLAADLRTAIAAAAESIDSGSAARRLAMLKQYFPVTAER